MMKHVSLNPLTTAVATGIVLRIAGVMPLGRARRRCYEIRWQPYVVEIAGDIFRRKPGEQSLGGELVSVYIRSTEQVEE